MHHVRAGIERFLLSPLYPFLFSIYFIFRIYVMNEFNIPLIDLFRPLLISLLAAIVCYLILLRLVWLPHTAALITTILLFSFYTYGLGWALLPARRTYSLAVAFMVVWTLVTLALIFLLGWKLRSQPNVNVIAGLNLMATILLLFPTIQVITVAIALPRFPPSNVHHVIQNTRPSPSPDIYYIILDAYARQDVLQDVFGYDNTEFIRSLQDLGFYVAQCSQSNYTSTAPSLTSSLNLDYLQNMSDTFHGGKPVDYLPVFKYIDDNAVQESVSNLGYKTVAFASGFYWAEWRDADLFIAPPNGPMTGFEANILLNSYTKFFDHMEVINFDDKAAERYRQRTRLVLENFDDLPTIPGPKFVFIHLVIPHAPNAFDENGNPVAPDRGNGRAGYVSQVKFINKSILPGLKALIERSATPPVIILQGDHGPIVPENHSAEMKILNAYYLPRGSEALYPSISPVNSFRVVFNTYFGSDFPLLDDISYFSDRNTLYDFSILPNSCPD